MANLALTPASIVPSQAATLQDAIAYEAMTQGQPVCYVTDPAFSLASASPTVRLADATVNYKVIGIAATGAAAGQPVKIILIDPSLAMGVSVAGDVLYLGPAAGTITSTYADLTTGKFVAVLGIGIGGGKVNFDPLRADVAK